MTERIAYTKYVAGVVIDDILISHKFFDSVKKYHGLNYTEVLREYILYVNPQSTITDDELIQQLKKFD